MADMSIVTFDYTAAWWTWEDWEVELDWLGQLQCESKGACGMLIHKQHSVVSTCPWRGSDMS
jgi:hypothetical protein